MSPNDFDIREIGRLVEQSGNNPARVLAFMLGEEQWNRLEAIEAEFTISHMRVLERAWLSHYGLDLGKLRGSAGL